jgi:class 3 adenylate cyclase
MNSLQEIAAKLVDRGVLPSQESGMPILQALLDMGYSDQPLQPHTSPDDKEYLSAWAHLQDADAWSLKRLRLFFTQRNKWLWRAFPNLYLEAGKAVLKKSEPLLAYDIFQTGLSTMGSNIRLSQLKADKIPIAIQLIRNQAASLAQSGAPSSAKDLLKQLIDQEVNDSETMGLLGRVYKDLAFIKPEKKEYYLRQAYTIYYRAFGRATGQGDQEGAYYNGINAATLAFLSGERAQAKKLAAEVEHLCLSLHQHQEETTSSFWLEATLGEAALLQGDLNRAGEYYEMACHKAKTDIPALSSIVKQARLIISHGKIKDAVQRAPSCMLPTVMVFSGHMIDSSSRKEARFPMVKEGEIKVRIAGEIKRLRGGMSYSAAAAGSDILFLEAMLENDGKIHIVLPVKIKDFKEQSVLPAGHDWEARFDSLVKQAESLTILDTFNPENFENSLEFTNMYLFGIARIRAEQMGTFLRPLAVLQPNDRNNGRGGTASMVRLWQGQKVEYSLIELQGGCQKPAPPPPMTSAAQCDCAKSAEHHTSLPMLFADVKGYSQLSEDEAVYFSNSFLKRIARILQHYHKAILSKRTAGDGLFLVFHDLQSAIDVARSLQEMIKKHDWKLDHLPENIQMRISLDAGPCYSYTDPVMDKLEFCGNYVVRAARLEPITPPGHIYASDTFVALCRAAGLGQGAFSYAGQVVLPKNYGTLAVFHVTP